MTAIVVRMRNCNICTVWTEWKIRFDKIELAAVQSDVLRRVVVYAELIVLPANL